MKLVDAHNHLDDERFGNALHEGIAKLQSIGVVYAVVNGTHPSNWEAVEALAQQYSWIIPSYGVHPWFINNLPLNWQDALRRYLERPGSCIGEVGIDHWKEGIDRAKQEEIFLAQLQIARELNIPVTFHGLKAWDQLLALLNAHGAPEAGFLLHSYSGPRELIAPFARLGGYFSCAPSFFAVERGKKLALFSEVPIERLLPESDAPDQMPPLVLDMYKLEGANGVGRINHPANISVVYDGLAKLLNLPVERLAEKFIENFTRLFR